MAGTNEQSGSKREDGERKGGERNGGERDRHGDDKHNATVLERIMGLLGAAIVLGVIGFMLYEAVFGEKSPPDLQVELVSVVDSGDDYLVQIRVRNVGGSTAAGVSVTGALAPAGASSQGESATVSIDYVPPASQVQAGMFFDQRPTAATLQLGVDGYVVP